MKYIKRIVLLLVSAILFGSVFILDVIHSTVEFEIPGLPYIREIILLIAFLCIYFFLRQQELLEKISPRQLTKLLVATFISFGVLAVSSFLVKGHGYNSDVTVHFSYRELYGMFIVAFALGFLSILSYLIVRQLVLFKRKKWTLQIFYFYTFFLLLYSYVNSPLVVRNGDSLSGIWSFPVVILIVLISFRQTWIVVLSKREKITTIFLAFLLSASFIVTSALVRPDSNLSFYLRSYSAPLYNFVFYSMLCGAIYFGFTWISALFHLPTAELFERKQFELHSLHNLSRLVTQVFDFQQLVTSVTQITKEACGARSVWLEFYKPIEQDGNNSVSIVASAGISMQDAQMLSQASLFIQGHSDLSKPLVIDDIWRDRRTKHLRRQGVERLSLAVVPLLSHRNLIGALYATKSVAEGFFQDDIDVLMTLADHGSIAIENSQLIEKSLERERLKQEMLVAQKMQQRLFPQMLPDVPEIEISAFSAPSYEVGGDYYDFVVLDESRVGIGIADVSGKGVSAAFYMAEVKGIFLALTPAISSPKDFLVRANFALSGSLDKKSFVSFLYGILDRKNGTLTIARAGHCPVLYLSNGKLEIIRPNGLGLGLTQEPVFGEATEERTLHLQNDDLCIFFTDGIIEARKENGEEFGMERLSEIVQRKREWSAEELKQTIQREVFEFIGSSSYKDDVTLIVLKWLGKN